MFLGSGGCDGVGGCCAYEGSLSVEKDVGICTENDFGICGTAGILETDRCWLFDELNMLLSGRLLFLDSTRAFNGSEASFGVTSLAFSGMLSAPLLRLFTSMGNVLFFDSCVRLWFSFNFVGDPDLDCEDDIHDFLLNLDSDREGDSEWGGPASVRESWRLRRGFGSSDGSLLLLEKERNLDVRRELDGRNCGICSAWGASSESGLEPLEDEKDVA